jgi:hypothetical protein
MVAASQAARWRAEVALVIAFFDCGDELFSTPLKIENYAPVSISCSARALPLPPPDRPGQPVKQQNRETRTMTMISEKAVALLLAVALSGTAFNTFIV